MVLAASWMLARASVLWPREADALTALRRGNRRKAEQNVVGVDVFCGAGGLTYGLQQAGIAVAAGIDLDPACEFPFTQNNGSKWLEADVRKLTTRELAGLYPKGSIRLLAGCAPCRPFSPYRRGEIDTDHHEWGLLEKFGRLVTTLKPELVTMENVPDLASKPIFLDFVEALRSAEYCVHFRSVYCPRFGVPQHRRRLVLLASRIGPIKVPRGEIAPEAYTTVREAIGSLPPIAAGCSHPRDRLHRARALTDTNLRRLRASKPGGTWRDWPVELRALCHQKESGSSYQSVYARMSWDEPSPTITTQAYNFGTGRFGHPEQDRSLSLREAAVLQTFPRNYRFVAARSDVYFSTLGRLIGNAVPPLLARGIGIEIARVAAIHQVGRGARRA